MYVRLVSYIDAINQYRKTKISNRNFLVIAALIVGILAGLAAALLKSLTHHILRCIVGQMVVQEVKKKSAI